MKLKLILTALLLGLILCPMVSAYNVSFSSIDGSADRDIMVYRGGVLIGQWNTSSTVQIENDTQIVFRPQTQNILENPGLWLSKIAIPYVMTNALGIIFTFGIALLVLGRR